MQVYQLSIGAACGLSWPSDRIIIQVLDDSTDPIIKVHKPRSNQKPFVSSKPIGSNLHDFTPNCYQNPKMLHLRHNFSPQILSAAKIFSSGDLLLQKQSFNLILLCTSIIIKNSSLMKIPKDHIFKVNPDQIALVQSKPIFSNTRTYQVFKLNADQNPFAKTLEKTRF